MANWSLHCPADGSSTSNQWIAVSTATANPDTACANGSDAQTVYVFGSLELRRTSWSATAFDYERSDSTEVGYLQAQGVRLARLHYAIDSVPTSSSGALHVLMELPDHLGSTSIVIDQGTSELVEAATYLPYGGTSRPTGRSGGRASVRTTGLRGRRRTSSWGSRTSGSGIYRPASVGGLRRIPCRFIRLEAT
jgi:hypothetical protein